MSQAKIVIFYLELISFLALCLLSLSVKTQADDLFHSSQESSLERNPIKMVSKVMGVTKLKNTAGRSQFLL